MYVEFQSSFHALKNWIKELTRYGPPDILIAIAGNKCDKADQREVHTMCILLFSKIFSDQVVSGTNKPAVMCSSYTVILEDQSILYMDDVMNCKSAMFWSKLEKLNAELFKFEFDKFKIASTDGASCGL